MKALARILPGLALALAAGGCQALPLSLLVPAPAPSAAVPSAVTTSADANLPPVQFDQPAPDVHFLDMAGAPHALDEYKGKFVILAFFAYWCGHCVQELPQLQQLAAQNKDKNLAVVPVEATGAALDVVTAFQTRYTPSFGLFYDPSQGAVKPYQIKGYPTIYLIGPDGVAKEAVQGETTNDHLLARYQFYTAGAKPPG